MLDALESLTKAELVAKVRTVDFLYRRVERDRDELLEGMRRYFGDDRVLTDAFRARLDALEDEMIPDA